VTFVIFVAAAVGPSQPSVLTSYDVLVSMGRRYFAGAGKYTIT
jgi:hypothetical protein